jgi:hypothetical protein
MDRSVSSYPANVIVCIGLTLVSACVPSTLTTYKTSAEPSSSLATHNWFDGLILDLPGAITLRVQPPIRPNVDTAIIISLEIPGGHTARISGGTADISAMGSLGSWTGHLVSTEGNRFKNPAIDDPDTDVTRQLVGSTWSTHHLGQHDHSFYVFKIRSEIPYPNVFQVQLPPMNIDGKDVVVPALIFRFQKWLRWQGIGSS